MWHFSRLKAHAHLPTALTSPFSKLAALLLSGRVLLRLGILMLLMLLGGSFYTHTQAWLTLLDSEPIRDYSLTTSRGFTKDVDVRRALAQEPKMTGYFSQDVQEIVQKMESIPWVKNAWVKKLYPNSMNIVLWEYRPNAVWNDHHLLSEQGIVFELPLDRFNRAHLPRLYGPDKHSITALKAWQKISEDLRQRNLGLKYLEVDERLAWKITLLNDIELRLGRGEWLSKIDRFINIYPRIKVPEGQAIAYIDLRYENGAAVGFRPLNLEENNL